MSSPSLYVIKNNQGGYYAGHQLKFGFEVPRWTRDIQCAQKSEDYVNAKNTLKKDLFGDAGKCLISRSNGFVVIKQIQHVYHIA